MLPGNYSRDVNASDRSVSVKYLPDQNCAHKFPCMHLPANSKANIILLPFWHIEIPLQQNTAPEEIVIDQYLGSYE